MRRDRFGQRLPEPHPATLLADLAQSLRARAEGPDTGAARAEVAAALLSRWWGMRVLAMRAIGRWRTEADRAWLVERARRRLPDAAEVWNAPRGHELRWRDMETREARRVLFRRAPRREDSDWLLDLWFTEPGGRIWPSWLCGVPVGELRARIAGEIRGGDRVRLERVIQLLAWTAVIENRTEILGHLAANADAEVATLAKRRLDGLTPPPGSTPE